ncbi:MAG: glycosyltransferase family 2 protein [Burkholderiales bacterium]|nr:glycosyltransferase family 2 protein [Burkholderiales bacterium]
MKTLICVPVYGGLDSVERCLDALAAATVAAERRVLLIDDASPDARIAPLLARYALTMANTQYRRNRSNRGFTWNVNQAFTAAQPDEAVCLLNSDTLVTTGWLDAMLGCLAEDERIGTVTPFSNNATICSWPDFSQAWPVPPPAERERIAAALRKAPAAAIDLPTGVGFCLLISPSCRAAVGRFDVENFPRGYGEENDFCMRAAAAGFRNVLCPNAYVAHEGGASFSGERRALMEVGAARLLAKHPGYDEAVAAWIAADPARPRRLERSAALAASR